MSGKRWVINWMIIILIIPVIGGVNYLVDPFDVFGNKTLRKYYHKDRISPSINLTQNKYDTIIIGTSRTQRGINVLNPNLKGDVINASLSGSNVYEIHKAFNKIYETQKKEIDIIYGLDFFTFGDKRYPGEQFRQSLFNEDKSYFELLMSLLFSIDAIKTSGNTVIDNLKGKKDYVLNGFEYTENRKDRNYLELFDHPLKFNFLVDAESYGCFNYGRDRLELFEDILKKSKDRRLKLFISPLHHRQLFALKHLGLFDVYIKWIKDLSKITNKYSQQDGYEITLHDFSYLNSATAEPLSEYMENYWEVSHYKSSLGDQILDRLYGKEVGFGVQLNNANINVFLKKYITDYYDFIENHPQAYQDIFNLYLDTINIRQNACKKYDNIQTIVRRGKDYNAVQSLKKERKKSMAKLYSKN